MRLQLPEQEEVPTVQIILMNLTCKRSVLKSYVKIVTKLATSILL